MLGVKRVFSVYSADFWAFMTVIIGLTAFLYHIGENAGGFTILLGAVTVLFILLMQENRKLKTSPLIWFSAILGRQCGDALSGAAKSAHQASILLLSALSVAFAVNIVSRFMLGGMSVFVLIDTVIFAITLLTFVLTVRRGISNKLLYIIAFCATAMPVVMALLTGYFSSDSTPVSYIWCIASMVFCKFLLSRRAAQVLFKLSAVLMLLGLIIGTGLLSHKDLDGTIQFIIVTLSVGFVTFASLDFYHTNSAEIYADLEKSNEQLVKTQEKLIQGEQLATLGRLIAGVAHEINTPIGAIKASGELMDTFDLGAVLRDTSGFSDEDLLALTDLLGICAASLKNMRSTVELRRGRTQIRSFLKSIELPNAGEIGAALTALEICDVEKAANNQELLRRDNILQLLQAAQRIMPLLSSIQNIRFSSEKVTKIIFALKTFSHMNPTGEAKEFDIVKNIDNVLVLYLNQLKRGIEVIRQYENVPYVYGNAEEIGQVWTNIVQNAIYAMNYVGKLTISIKNLGGRFVEITFADTGTGIKPENIDKIFEPFFTTKPLGEGSGIGMDISRKVLRKFGGDIRVESTWGKGAAFIVRLPAKPDFGPDAEEVGAAS